MIVRIAPGRYADDAHLASGSVAVQVGRQVDAVEGFATIGQGPDIAVRGPTTTERDTYPPFPTAIGTP